MERLEVPVLVEDVVSRQQRFAEALIDAACAHERGAVVERPALVGRVRLGQTDENRRERFRVAREPLERLPALSDETRAEQQIARQVADERELGRDSEVGAGLRRPAQRVEDEPGVAGEVADRRVYLEQRDLHVVVRSVGTNHDRNTR